MHLRRTKWTGGTPRAPDRTADCAFASEPPAGPTVPTQPYERPAVIDKGPLANLTWATFAALDEGFGSRSAPRPDGG
jgi:hypothetical protein